ncbi:Type I Iterative PKS [Psilocybe cubensis]|uniref:Polyketide synthase n=2 Tax=Psilocybe cubensis TaxID=181762 RepID=A0A8H7XNV7_PSICU|nr:Type I Iterative PKS [Psilocybe cubensis]KAH9480833.1 Type I Iterative PKS [Psilocybe cubensis]
MASKCSNPIFLPAFGGQGTLYQDLFGYKTDLTSLSSFGITLLSACHAAFLSDLAALEVQELATVGICASEFTERESLLRPRNNLLFNNPAFCGPHLLLSQTLLYLSFSERHAAASRPIPFLDILGSNSHYGVGILGFSSGIIAACVVASSSNILQFITHAVDAYRFAFWIGVRSQLYRSSLVEISDVAPHPWAIVLMGTSRECLLRSIEHFNKDSDMDRIFLTAVLDDGRYTVSGHPRDLNLFVQTLPNGVASHVTAINTLYHCPSLLRGVRDAVLHDVMSKQIKFPTFLDLLAPIRSSFSGERLSNTTPGSLVETVTDLILMKPVLWDAVLHQTVSALPPDNRVVLIDIELGPSLVRGFQLTACRNGIQDFHTVYPKEEAMPTCEHKQDLVAIIGMAVNMPGAPSTRELWEIIKDGHNTVEKIPPNRFLFEEGGRTMRARTGNFIHDVDHFDNRFFNISPREAKSMDPQQRILLHAAYEALENAGYVPYGSPTFNPATIGCYVGAATHDYALNLRNNIDVYYATGTLNAFISGRVSYCLGLSGPSIVFDTACSSSFVAIHQACRALMNRDCHVALAGGVNVISSPDMFIGLDRGHFLNSSGQCKPFDASADGYSRGEGCGIFVLKRLTDAVRENDQILGVIRGVEVNQSGKGSSITHPHSPTQEELLKRLLMKSDVDFNSVNVVEVHGTGTQAGDTAEMESIRRLLLADNRAPDNPLYITSIKSNIGHLEAASGCASLAKILLMLRHEMIPRQIPLSALNPQITRLFSDKCILPTRNVPWMPPKRKTPRMAIVNNFGAAGSNTALLLQEYVPQESTRPDARVSSYVFGISAKDEDALEALRSKYLSWLQRPSTHDISILDIAYTSTARRQLFSYRLATSAGSIEQLVQKLEKELIVHVPCNEVGPEVVFVFSGQGHKSNEMARSLYKTSAVFRRHIDECNSVLISNGFAPIVPVIVGSGDDQHLVPAVQREEVIPTATFALQYALSKLWITWGIMPVAAVGHRSVFRHNINRLETKVAKRSLGEYAALVTAGVLRLEDAIIIVATRARLVLERCPPMATGMVAISLEPTKLQHILDSSQSFANTSIACYNSPGDCVVSGPLHELEGLISYLQKEGSGRFTRLDVPYGHHSPLMSHLTGDLVELAGKAMIFPPRIPFLSTVLGRVIIPGDRTFLSQDYFARQCVEPVKFTEAIGSYLSNYSGKRIWLEISPHPIILPMLRSFPVLSDSPLLASLRACEDSWTSLSKSLTSFYCLGGETVRWRSVFGEIGPAKCIGLPSYPFNKTSFWVPYVGGIDQDGKTARGAHSSLIKECVQFPGGGNNKEAIFRTPISQFKHFIKSHLVGGVPLCPASVYLKMISGAINLTAGYALQHVEDTETVMCQLSFPNPLISNDTYSDEASIAITIDLSNKSLSLGSRAALVEPPVTHASGKYYTQPIMEITRQFAQIFPSIVERVHTIVRLARHRGLETFSARTIYRVIFPRVVEYSPNFHTIQSLTMLDGGMEAAGSMALPSAEYNAVTSHIVFLDTLIHAAGFLCNLRSGQNDAYVCVGIGSLEVLSNAIREGVPYTVYCRITPFETEELDVMIGETCIISAPHSTFLIAHCKAIKFQRVRISSLKRNLGSKQRVSALPLDHHGCPSFSSGIVEVVINMVSKACDVLPGDISVSADLKSLGVDSLMRIELSYSLSTMFPGYGFRPQELSLCKTVADVVESVISALTTKVNLDGLGERSSNVSSSGPSTPRSIVSSDITGPSVKKIIARALEIHEDNIKDYTKLSSLGLDSLTSIEIANSLRQEWKVNVPANLFNSCDTILDIKTQIPELQQSVPSTLVCRFPLTIERRNNDSLTSQTYFSLLQTGNPEHVPLVLVHDGTGLTGPYTRLSNLGRPVWTISNPSGLSSHIWSSLEEMAESYSRTVLHKIHGPVILGGWSFGGVVAFEMARQIREKSLDVLGLVLIDSPSPLVSAQLSSGLIDKIVKHLEPNAQDFCKSQLMTNSELLRKYSPWDFTHKYPLVFLMSEQPYPTFDDFDIPAWLSDRSSKSSATFGWEILSEGPIETFSIPGHHFQAFDPQNVSISSFLSSQSR